METQKIRRNTIVSTKQLHFLSTKTSRSFAIIIRLLEIIHELLMKNLTATKRLLYLKYSLPKILNICVNFIFDYFHSDVFYKDVQLFGSQHAVDMVRMLSLSH